MLNELGKNIILQSCKKRLQNPCKFSTFQHIQGFALFIGHIKKIDFV